MCSYQQMHSRNQTSHNKTLRKAKPIRVAFSYKHTIILVLLI